MFDTTGPYNTLSQNNSNSQSNLQASSSQTFVENNQKQSVSGIWFMLIGSVSMGLMNIGARYVKQETTVSVLQTGLVRYIFMALGCYFHAQWSQVSLLEIPQDKAIWVFLRALFGFLSSIFQFAAIFMLPFGMAVVLYFTQPITASIINWLFNNEKLSVLNIFSIIFALIGVVMLTNPTLVFPFLDEAQSNYFSVQEYPQFNLGVVLALTGSLCSGFAYLAMRKTGDAVHSVVPPFYFGVFGVLASYVSMVALSDPLVQEFDFQAFYLLMIVGFFGWTAQEGVSKAMQTEKAGRAAPLNYLQVVMAWLADVYLFGVDVKWTDIAATFCIIFFTFLGVVQKGFCAHPPLTEENKDQLDIPENNDNDFKRLSPRRSNPSPRKPMPRPRLSKVQSQDLLKRS